MLQLKDLARVVVKPLKYGDVKLFNIEAFFSVTIGILSEIPKLSMLTREHS